MKHKTIVSALELLEWTKGFLSILFGSRAPP
jgi:hypothetical protein